MREPRIAYVLEVAGYETSLVSMEARHLRIGLMTQDHDEMLAISLASQSELVGPTTQVAAEMLVLVSQACEVAEVHVGHSV